MNLTNDNPIGCHQIAACGGLDTMVSLIINHFPSYDLNSSMCGRPMEDTTSSTQTSVGHLNNKHLTDHGLDFLVAILGLLVNLVEKDSQNRLFIVSVDNFSFLLFLFHFLNCLKIFTICLLIIL